MKVPFRLHRRTVPEPATALVLASLDVAELLALCVRLGCDPLPRLFTVADGFLLLLDAATNLVPPRTMRLRRLAEHLLLPADAELVPSLHPDEASALTRHRGLVFLPGGRVLAFAPDSPLSLSQLLQGDPPRRETWQAFPERPAQVERIESIRLELPQPPPEEILNAGAPDGAEATPRPDAGGVLGSLAAGAAMAAGQGLMNVGKLLGWKGLAAAGAGWVEKAVSWVPRLSESVLGRQEAALRELLRQFREGNLEAALRRALPLGAPGGRGGSAASDANLPIHSLNYSLGNLLGARGAASLWFGGYDVQAELAKEYRKAAEEAAQRGDYRRAAFIYGKLLADYRAAADVLFRGGLYTDAATLYLTMLDDRRSAARAFAAAGNIDRAVELYRQLGDHVAAGDLLRQAGEEDAAVAEYTIAAELLAHKSDWLGAGDLMAKAGRPQEADTYWSEGWKHRPQTNDVSCALRLADHLASTREPQRLLTLMREGCTFFDSLGNDAAAGRFFNAVAALADRDALTEVRDELRDQARLGLACKLRQNTASVRRGEVVAQLLGQPGTWPAAVVSDAHFAMKVAERPRSSATLTPRPTRVSLGGGTITAVGTAVLSGEVFVGFEDGGIAYFRPVDAVVERVSPINPAPVTSLAVAPDGQVLLTLQDPCEYHAIPEGAFPEGAVVLGRFIRQANGRFCPPAETEGVWVTGEPFLAPELVPNGKSCYFGIWRGTHFEVRSTGDVLRVSSAAPCQHALLVPAAGTHVQSLGVLLFHDNATWGCWDIQNPNQGSSVDVVWRPTMGEGNTLRQAPLSWQRSGSQLEVVGLGPEHSMRWLRMNLSRHGPLLIANASWLDEDCHAATVLRPGFAAVVTMTQIVWLRRVRNEISIAARTRRSGPPALACFTSLPTNELLIVCADGSVERVRIAI